MIIITRSSFDVIFLINANNNKKLFVGNINLVNIDCKLLRDVKYFTPYFTLCFKGMTLTNQACVWDKNLNKRLGLLKI